MLPMVMPRQLCLGMTAVYKVSVTIPCNSLMLGPVATGSEAVYQHWGLDWWKFNVMICTYESLI
jgi:hypothetical protein